MKYAKDGVNAYRYRPVRFAGLWKPNEDFHAQLSYYHQTSNADGFPYAATSSAAYNQPISPANQPSGAFTNPALATQLYNSPVPAGVDRLSTAENALTTTQDTFNMVALAVEYDIGFATLTSATSIAHHTDNTLADETAEYANFYFSQSYYGQNPRQFVQGHEEYSDKPFSQEFRLTSKTGGFFDWVGGFFYKSETSTIQENDYYPGYLNFFNACASTYGISSGVGESAYTPGTPKVVQGIQILKEEAFVSDFETKFKDIALFGELTGHVTSDWSVTAGARVFRQTVSQSQQTGLLYKAATPILGVIPVANSSADDSWKPCLVENQHLLPARQDQSRVRDLVPRIPAR